MTSFPDIFLIDHVAKVATVRAGDHDLTGNPPIDLEGDWTLRAEGGPVTLLGEENQWFMKLRPRSALQTEGEFRFRHWDTVFGAAAVPRPEREPIHQFRLMGVYFNAVRMAVFGQADGPPFESCDITHCKFTDGRFTQIKIHNALPNGCNVTDLDFVHGRARCIEIGREDREYQRSQFSNIRIRNIFVKDLSSIADYQRGHVLGLLIVGYNVHIEGITGENVRSTEGEDNKSALLYVKCHHGLVRGIVGNNAGGQGQYGMVAIKGAPPWHDSELVIGSNLRVENLSYTVDDDWPGGGLERCDRALLIAAPFTNVSGVTSYGGGIKAEVWPVGLTLADCEIRNRRTTGFSIASVGGIARLMHCRDYDPRPETSNPGFQFTGFPNIPGVDTPPRFPLDACFAGEYHRVTYRPRRAIKVLGSVSPRVHGFIGVDSTIDEESPFVKPLWMCLGNVAEDPDG